MVSKLFSCFVTILLGLASVGSADEHHASHNSLLKAYSADWLTLVHYRKTLTGYKSYVDDGEFFSAETGKYDPQAELEATLRSFFTEPESVCRFPARFDWLSQQAEWSEKFKDYNLLQLCPEFQKWFDLIAARDITLVFPASFVNNPASAFGHTFIRLDQDRADLATALTSYAVNFSAQTFGEPGLIYAAKGLLGGYQGNFAVSPYYKLVKTYSDLENRDIWEYHFDFEQNRIDLLVAHLWELREINFDYYYFDENCSYQLLGLFDLLDSRLDFNQNMRGQIPAWVIPADTLRMLVEKYPLQDQVYRPALLSRISGQLKGNDSSDAELIKLLIEQKAFPENWEGYSPSRQAELLDLAYEFQEHLLNKGKLKEKNSGDNNQQSYWLLAERSKLGIFAPAEAVAPQANPLDAHPSKRLSLYAGNFNGQAYLDLNFRPVYHDLLDQSAGFLPGSAIDFMEFSFRKLAAGSFKLNRAKFVDIYSLNIDNDLIKPVSWRLFSGLQRTDFRTEQSGTKSQKLSYYNQLYLGKSYSLFTGNQIYLLAGPATQASTHYDDKFLLGAGINAGLRQKVSGEINGLLDLRLNRYWQDDFTELEIAAGLDWQLNRQYSLRLTYQFAHNQAESSDNTTALGLNYYF